MLYVWLLALADPPALRAWLFGTGLEDNELAILASAYSRIYRYLVQDGLGEAIESSPGVGHYRGDCL
ncbi:hypothetical protein LAZ67_12002657 [Cordylochernes scorpioides]|uniref:Uncharacterized protein n=1 Tax=Cordylochernes scorpioides TaxID=51811 RepID=A0ABY6L1X8_9ARAC|nr:hypothetical protein LAZ67_12002657 [Cordylochernes scorpioides]